MACSNSSCHGSVPGCLGFLELQQNWLYLFVIKLIPLWIMCGFNGLLPCSGLSSSVCLDRSSMITWTLQTQSTNKIPSTAKTDVQWYLNESPSIKVHFLHSSETQDTICISISLFKETIDKVWEEIWNSKNLEERMCHCLEALSRLYKKPKKLAPMEMNKVLTN